MKSLSLLLSATLSAHATLIQFDLSPPGADVAVGLSPSNEVPAVLNSTGSGNEISGGVFLDTDTFILHLAIGYGSAAGFTDLTGVPTAMHIHGSAPTGSNAPVLISLVPFNFPAADPARGGVIIGNIPFPTNNVPDLLAGLNYVNIHTTNNPGGEVRAQLVPVIVTNAPPAVTCPPASTVECGTAALVTILIADPEGDALTVSWTVDGTGVQTNTLPASTPGAAMNVSLSRLLVLGAHVVAVTVSDTASNSTSCSSAVTVVDTTPPVITSVSANPRVLWPPNHKLVEVHVRAEVTDTCGPTTWRIISVSSSEPVNGRGDGNTSPDWQITGDHTVKLRAERSGGGTGRTYTVTVQATDDSGNISAPKTVTLTVPKSQGRN